MVRTVQYNPKTETSFKRSMSSPQQWGQGALIIYWPFARSSENPNMKLCLSPSTLSSIVPLTHTSFTFNIGLHGPCQSTFSADYVCWAPAFAIRTPWTYKPNVSRVQKSASVKDLQTFLHTESTESNAGTRIFEFKTLLAITQNVEFLKIWKHLSSAATGGTTNGGNINGGTQIGILENGNLQHSRTTLGGLKANTKLS